MNTFKMVSGNVAFRLACIFVFSMLLFAQCESAVAAEVAEQPQEINDVQTTDGCAEPGCFVVSVGTEETVIELDFENENTFFDSVQRELGTIYFDNEAFVQTREIAFPVDFFEEETWNKLRKIAEEESVGSDVPVSVHKVRINGQDYYMFSTHDLIGLPY